MPTFLSAFPGDPVHLVSRQPALAAAARLR
jgi:hypothetical protein